MFLSRARLTVRIERQCQQQRTRRIWMTTGNDDGLGQLFTNLPRDSHVNRAGITHEPGDRGRRSWNIDDRLQTLRRSLFRRDFRFRL